MNLHMHARFHLYGVFKCAGRHSDRFHPHDRGIPPRIDLFVDTILIQICTEVHTIAGELYERRGNLHRKAHDLIGNEMLFEGRPRLRTVIDDANRIAAIETIRRAMVPRISVVVHSDRHALQSFCSGNGGHIGEEFLLDRLEWPFTDLPAIVPFVSNLIWEIVGGLANGICLFRCNERWPSTTYE